MIDALVLRFDAPMMSFGGTLVDHVGVTMDFPGRSMLAGLLGNALGYQHQDFERLQRLQERLRLAVRCDRAGQRIIDYHTVLLGQPWMLEGWTTRGRPEGRLGGPARTGTHVRLRHYIADAVYTVALRLEPPDEAPTLEDLGAALQSPERPLFIGRKCCLPAAPILLGFRRAENLARAALLEPLTATRRHGAQESVRLWVDEGEGRSDGLPRVVADERDWANQLHVGSRYLRELAVSVEELAP